MIVLVAGLLVLFILVNKNGEDNLNKFCGDPQPTYSGLWDKLDNLRSYDNEVEMIGGTGGSLCQDGCACQLPTSPPIPTNSLTGNKYGAYRDNHVAG